MRQLNPGLITDATPRMCIQFDDTRSGIFNQVAEYLKRGLPVTLAAHVANVVAGTGLSIQEIKDLIKMAEDHGTTLSLAQHSNSDFEKLRGPYDPLDFTYEDLRDELDPSQIIDVFGARVFSGGYMQSGTPQTLAYCRDHIDMIHGILEEFGYTHAYYLTNDWYYGQAVGVPLLPDTESARSNTAVDTQIYYYGGAELNSYGACHPGLIKNKFWIPAGYALDLGNNCVPRGAYNGTAWVADPRSGASPWVLGVDEGTITQDYTATVQFQIAKRLAHGGSSVLLWHDENDTNTLYDLSLPSGNVGAPVPGHFSHKHIAWMLDELQRLGHVRVGTVEDHAEYCLSEWAPGVDTVQNPNFEVPLLDLPRVVDQTIDSNVANTYTATRAGGFTSSGTVLGSLPTEFGAKTAIPYSTWSENYSVDVDLMAFRGCGCRPLQGANPWAVAKVGAAGLGSTGTTFDPTEDTGATSTGVTSIRELVGPDVQHPDGHVEGGVLMYPASSVAMSALQFGKWGLPPGLYTVSYDIWLNEQVTSNFVIDSAVVGCRRYASLEQDAVQRPNVSGVAEPMTYMYKRFADGVFNINRNDTDKNSGSISFQVDLRTPYKPMRFKKFTVAAQDGVTETGTLTFEGALPGAEVFVGMRLFNDGIWRNTAITAYVSDVDEVTWVLYDTHAGFNDNLELHIGVEDLVHKSRVDRGLLSPLGDPVYGLVVETYPRDGVPDAVLRNPRIVYEGK